MSGTIGTGSNDNLNGGSGDDTIDGGAGNDKISAGSGSDIIDGGSGSDTVNGGSGDDTLIYVLAENQGAGDVYTGGSGSDTVRVSLTQAEWESAAVQSEIARYVQFLSTVKTNQQGEVSNGTASEFKFAFNSTTTLTVQMMEMLDVYVNGVQIDYHAPNIFGSAVNASMQETDATLTATGTLNVVDIDTANKVTMTVDSVVVDPASTGPNPLGAAALKAMMSVSPSTPINADVGDSAFSWTFTSGGSGDEAFNFLAQGQTLLLKYTLKATDDSPQALTDTQVVTVTITGTNDAPVVAATDVTGAVAELVSPVGDLSDSGTIDFSDVDLADVHSVGAVTASAGALGTLSASVTTDTTGMGSGGVVTWNYTVAASAVEHLAADETKVETFTFDVSDGHGGVVPRTVTVTITGTNDRPELSVTANDAGSITLTESNAGLVASASLTVTDVDTADTIASSVIAVTASGTTTGLGLTDAQLLEMFSVAPTSGLAADSGDAGNLTWTFDSGSQAFDFLGAGQSLTLTYTVHSSDGLLASDTQDVTVTISGTNDAPVITSNGGGDTAAISVAENTTAVTTVTSSDIDSPSRTYTLAGGADASRFTIDATTGVLSFVAAPDFEAPSDFGADNVYDVIVQASDGSAVDTQAIAVTVTDVVENQAPTDIMLNGTSVGGGGLAGAGVTVAALSTLDPDAGDTVFSYALLSQTANGDATSDFTISGSNLGVAMGQSLDASTTYALNVQTSDAQGATYSEVFRVVTGTNANVASDAVTGGNDDATPYSGEDILLGGNGGSGGGGNADNVDVLLGLGGNDVLYGQGGRDQLHGGEGNDQLYGGADNDLFVFNTTLNSATNVDAVRDFEANGTDKVVLDDDIFTALGPVGGNTALNVNNFRASAGGNAADANDFILYDTATGNLYYDADGNAAGGKVLFATLTVVSGTVDSSDFLVGP